MFVYTVYGVPVNSSTPSALRVDAISRSTKTPFVTTLARQQAIFSAPSKQETHQFKPDQQTTPPVSLPQKANSGDIQFTGLHPALAELRECQRKQSEPRRCREIVDEDDDIPFWEDQSKPKDSLYWRVASGSL